MSSFLLVSANSLTPAVFFTKNRNAYWTDHPSLQRDKRGEFLSFQQPVTSSSLYSHPCTVQRQMKHRSYSVLSLQLTELGSSLLPAPAMPRSCMIPVHVYTYMHLYTYMHISRFLCSVRLSQFLFTTASCFYVICKTQHFTGSQASQEENPSLPAHVRAKMMHSRD